MGSFAFYFKNAILASRRNLFPVLSLSRSLLFTFRIQPVPCFPAYFVSVFLALLPLPTFSISIFLPLFLSLTYFLSFFLLSLSLSLLHFLPFYIYLSLFLSFCHSLSRTGNIYYFRSVSLIRILKQGELVMKNRGPFQRDVDDGKCFVRLSRCAHLETTLVSLFLYLFLFLSVSAAPSLFLSLALPLSLSISLSISFFF